jgi:hypothetical protein
MVDSVSFDVLYGGNRQAIQSGVCYYTFTTSTAIPLEIPETVAAYNRLKTILPLIITSQPVTVSTGNYITQVLGAPAGATEATAVQNMATLITNIISSKRLFNLYIFNIIWKVLKQIICFNSFLSYNDIVG